MDKSPTEEWVDIVDPSTSDITGSLPRSQAHSEAQWHQVFHCLVIRRSTASVILQERSLAKAAFPGLLDLSATGHLAAGETVAEGVREVEEELGIEVNADDLISLGTRLLADDGGEGKNREVVHVHFLPDERTLEEYKPEPSEVSALIEVRVEDLLSILADAEASVPARRLVTGPAIEDCVLRQADLVEGADGYWTVLAVMADRFLRGLTPIAV